jgi:hypothetical protein
VQRRVALPVPVREENAQADLKDGVLTLRIPKIQKAPAKRITIGDGARETESAPMNEGSSRAVAEGAPSRGNKPR